MLFTSLSYRWVGETASHRVNYDEELAKTRMLGMMDDNLDGKLEKAELKGQMGAMLLKYFDVLDKNHDGALDRSELAAAQAMMGPRRRADSAPTPSAPAGGK
jgi:Ca2+-binding EF-hand superfamily protein